MSIAEYTGRAAIDYLLDLLPKDHPIAIAGADVRRTLLRMRFSEAAVNEQIRFVLAGKDLYLYRLINNAMTIDHIIEVVEKEYGSALILLIYMRKDDEQLFDDIVKRMSSET